MKPEYVVDIHALIWHLQNLSELSLKVRGLFSQIDAGKARAIVPTIVLVEIIYLILLEDERKFCVNVGMLRFWP